MCMYLIKYQLMIDLVVVLCPYWYKLVQMYIVNKQGHYVMCDVYMYITVKLIG